MNNDLEFYDSSWEKWQDMKKYGPMSRHTRRLCLEMIKNLNFNSIIDIGCGEASFLKRLQKIKAHVKASGADISEFMIKQNKKLLSEIEFYAMDIEKEPLNKKYDLVTAIEIIEHIKDDEKFLKNICKMTNKYLLICTLLGKMMPWEKKVGHVRNYSENELVDKLNNSGFSVLKIKKWGFPFYSPLYRSILQHTPDNLNIGKFGLFRKIVSQFLYFVFLLSLPNKGDVVLVLAEPVQC